MRPFSRLLAFSLALAACSEATTEPPEPTLAAIHIEEDSLVLRVGEDIRINVRGTDAKARDVALPASLSLESREVAWLAGSQVVTLTPAHEVRGVSPGRAMVYARAAGATPDSVSVRVIMERPTVFALAAPERVGDGDTLVLRGYRMDAIPTDSIQVDGERAAVLARDSATLRLSIPTLRTTTCRGVAATHLTLRGADTRSSLRFIRKRVGEIALNVGDAVRLTDEQVACLRLRPAPAAEYALAFVDTRGIERSLRTTDFAGHALFDSAYTVAIQGRSGQPSASPARSIRLSAASLPGRPAHPGDEIRPQALRSGVSLSERATPWQVGEVFQGRWNNEDLPAKVVRIYDGRFVVAVLERDLSKMTKEGLAYTDSVMALILQYDVPLMRQALTDKYPVTSTGSGQLLITVGWGASFGSYGASASTFRESSRIEFYLPDAAQGGLGRGILSHELTHTWQGRYMWDTCPDWMSDHCGAKPLWGSEGGANLIPSEGYRLSRGAEFLSEWDNTFGGGDRFIHGFGVPDFQLDLMRRMVVEKNIPHSRAVREVSRGVIEGWSGRIHPDAVQRPGLVRRMQNIFGPSWNAPDAMLTWAMSQILDDRTPSKTFQNLHRKDSWRGWPPLATAVAGEGTHASTTLPDGGGTANLAIKDDGLGGSFQLSSSVEGTLWMIGRIR